MNLVEYRSYTNFDESDELLLRAIWPLVEPRAVEIIDGFYDRVLAHESTRSIVSDPEQVARLKRTLVVWLEELLTGPWDEVYATRRARIGGVHVHVGVDHGTMFMAMTAMQSDLCDLARRSGAPPGAEDAIRKVTLLDLCLMTSSYHESIEDQRVRDARALLVSHLPAVALLVDAAGIVLGATPAAEWLLNRQLESGKHYSDLLPIDILERTQIAAYITRALESGHDVRVPGIEIQARGSTHHVSMTLVPFDQPEPGVLVYIEDHTQAVDAERHAQQQAHLARIGTLSATIAHELRNPLAGISGALQVIAGGLDEGDRRAPVLAKVLAQVRALNQMVTDLLTYARPHESQVEDGIDLVALVEGVFDSVRADFPDHNMEVEGSGVASIDPNMVRQVLLNLVYNACQALDSEGLVHISVSPHELIVCDDGPGLPPDVASRIFEPFFTTKLKGTGLGLPISAKLARAMGGELEVLDESRFGGACFSLSLGRSPRQRRA